MSPRLVLFALTVAAILVLGPLGCDSSLSAPSPSPGAMAPDPLVVTGVAPGSATISASAGGKTGNASITVQLAPVDRIVVTPANPTVNIGQTAQLTATLYDQHNNVLIGRTVTWSRT